MQPRSFNNPVLSDAAATSAVAGSGATSSTVCTGLSEVGSQASVGRLAARGLKEFAWATLRGSLVAVNRSTVNL